MFLVIFIINYKLFYSYLHRDDANPKILKKKKRLEDYNTLCLLNENCIQCVKFLITLLA